MLKFELQIFWIVQEHGHFTLGQDRSKHSKPNHFIRFILNALLGSIAVVCLCYLIHTLDSDCEKAIFGSRNPTFPL